MQIQSPIITKKVQKKEDLLKTWLSPKNRLKISDEKKLKKFPILARRTKQWNHNTRKATTEHGRRKWKKTESKLKSSFRNETVGTLKTRSKNPSPDPFNFYVVLAGHDMVTDAGRATTCRHKFKAPLLKTNTKNERPSQKHEFHLISVWIFQTKKIKKYSFRKENKTKETQDHKGKNWTWTM